MVLTQFNNLFSTTNQIHNMMKIFGLGGRPVSVNANRGSKKMLLHYNKITACFLGVFGFWSDISMYDVREWCFQLLKNLPIPGNFCSPARVDHHIAWDIYNLFPSSFRSTAQFNPHHIQYICQQDWSGLATNPRIFMENYGKNLSFRAQDW